MNHTTLNLKSKIAYALRGLSTTNIWKKDNLTDYYMVTKKNQHGEGLVYKDGRVIVPYNANFKILDFSRDTVLVYNGLTKTVDAVSLTSGKIIYSTLAYSSDYYDAKFVYLYFLNEDRSEYEHNLTFSIIKDATKRYRVTNYDGKEVANGILDYQVFDNSEGEALYIALRYEDHFGILDNTGTITKCEILSKFEKQLFTLPAYFGNVNESGNANDYFFLDLTGYVKTNSPYKEIKLCHDEEVILKSQYPCIYRVMTKDDRYILLNVTGEKVIDKSFYTVFPFVSNRAIVKENKDDYYYVIDENGREIRRHNILIKGVARNYEKIRYNEFMMTLALIYDDVSNSLVYVDKELNKYFYTPER